MPTVADGCLKWPTSVCYLGRSFLASRAPVLSLSSSGCSFDLMDLGRSDVLYKLKGPI